MDHLYVLIVTDDDVFDTTADYQISVWMIGAEIGYDEPRSCGNVRDVDQVQQLTVLQEV